MAHQDSTDDIEKLLKIVEEKPEVKVRFEDTEVEKFIAYLKITAGDAKIPGYVIYYEYYKWNKKSKPLARRIFFTQFAKHFERKISGSDVTYLLSGEQFDMSPEGYFRARSQLRRERHERKKKKQKAERKKSSTQS